MPGDGCLKAPGLTAEVTITWSPQTIGDDQPRPGTSARHATLIVVDHFVGSVSIDETARPAGPRNCGHTRSGGAGAAGTSVVMKSSSVERMALTGAIVPRGQGNYGTSCGAPRYASVIRVSSRVTRSGVMRDPGQSPPSMSPFRTRTIVNRLNSIARSGSGCAMS